MVFRSDDKSDSPSISIHHVPSPSPPRCSAICRYQTRSSLLLTASSRLRASSTKGRRTRAAPAEAEGKGGRGSRPHRMSLLFLFFRLFTLFLGPSALPPSRLSQPSAQLSSREGADPRLCHHTLCHGPPRDSRRPLPRPQVCSSRSTHSTRSGELRLTLASPHKGPRRIPPRTPRGRRHDTATAPCYPLQIPR